MPTPFKKSSLSKFLFFQLIIFSIACGGSGSGTGANGVGGGGGGSSAGEIIITGFTGGGDVPVVGIPGGEGTTGGGGGGGGSGGNPPGSGGGGGGSSTNTVSVSPGNNSIAIATFTGAPSEDGIANITLALANTTSFQVVSQQSGALIGTLSLSAPGGTVVLDSDENSPPKTFGLYLDLNGVNVLGYPTFTSDPAVANGDYLQQLYSVFDDSAAPFAGTLIAKNDSNLAGGTLLVNLFLVGAEAQEEDTRDAIDVGVELWRDIYATIGITLDIETIEVTSNTGILPNPAIGSSFYLSNSTAPNIRAQALNVFIGEDISDSDSQVPGDSADALGVAAGIPGPAVPSSRSAVAVSIALHSGADLSFTVEEAELLGETMAHEAGHYLGLFHPVESDFSEGDALADTATCASIPTCISSGVGANLMFFTPIGGLNQRTMTADQGEVANLQTIVR